MGTESKVSYSAPLESLWRTLLASLSPGLETVMNCQKTLLAFSPPPLQAEISHDLKELKAIVWMLSAFSAETWPSLGKERSPWSLDVHIYQDPRRRKMNLYGHYVRCWQGVVILPRLQI